MTELNQTLPLLPLTSGVALPGMVFTLALETDEARAAADAAGAAGGRLVLVPVTWTAATPSSGWWPRSWRSVTFPVVPGPWSSAAPSGHRIGTAVPGTGTRPLGPGRAGDRGRPQPEAVELAREYRAVLENILHHQRGPAGWPSVCGR